MSERVTLIGVNEIIADSISLQEGNDIVNVSNKCLSRSEAFGQFNTKADKQTTDTKTWVDTTFSNLIDSAPDALNTLKELATALNDDKDYAATVQNQLSQKAPTENQICHRGHECEYNQHYTWWK